LGNHRRRRDARDHEGLSLLHVSAFAASPPLLRWLRQFGVTEDGDDHLDNQGRSPLHYAAMAENSHVCDMLIKWGWTVNANDFSQKSPLDYAKSDAFRDQVCMPHACPSCGICMAQSVCVVHVCRRCVIRDEVYTCPYHILPLSLSPSLNLSNLSSKSFPKLKVTSPR
jgi:hypothetical protein